MLLVLSFCRRIRGIERGVEIRVKHAAGRPRADYRLKVDTQFGSASPHCGRRGHTTCGGSIGRHRSGDLTARAGLGCGRRGLGDSGRRVDVPGRRLGARDYRENGTDLERFALCRAMSADDSRRGARNLDY